MELPTFTALNSLYKGNKRYGASRIDLTDNKIILQECGWLKKAGCTIGPFSWCALASLGGASAYWNCVDQVSKGGCLDCLTGNDPRDNQDRTINGFAGVNEQGKFVGYGSQGLTSSNGDIYAQLNEINSKLKKIERCACAPTILNRLPFDYLQYIGHL